jgi:hypothetical protein
MLFLGVLVASVAVPYVLLSDQLASTARGQWHRLFGPASDEADEAESDLAAAGGPELPRLPGATIEQAFRFDITPQWVASRWPRVSTVLGEPEHLGMRVAWVSGTRGDDVAGSLTYYFDQHHQLQRITFTGLTIDPRRLLACVVTQYGLKSQPTTDAAHYIAGDPDDPTSEVVVHHLPVLTAQPDEPRAEVWVELRRPTGRATGKRSRDPDGKLLPSTYRRW